MSHATTAPSTPSDITTAGQTPAIGYAVGFAAGGNSGTITYNFTRTGKVISGNIKIAPTALAASASLYQIDDITSHGSGANTKFVPDSPEFFMIFTDTTGGPSGGKIIIKLDTDGKVYLCCPTTTSLEDRYGMGNYKSSTY